MKAWPVLAIVFIEAILFLAHWFIYHTWIVFWGNPAPAATLALGTALFLLAFSFIVAALLSFHFSNPLVTLIYKIAAVWLGFLNLFFLAACLCWLVWYPLLLSRLVPDPFHGRPFIAAFLFALALSAGIYGLLNALWIRIRCIPIQLPNLPQSWRGRTALLVSDLHLGHVNGLRFCRRIAALAARLNPDIIFLPGDFFDGAKTDPDRLAAPFKQLSPPFGSYFSTGNHDEFGNAAQHSAALSRAGVQVLHNQKVTVDGLQILGVTYHDSTQILRLRATLESLRLDPAHPSILLNHVPNRLPIIEQAGVSLQLSGHTHGGQLFPFTWIIRRVFGEFTYGLQRFGALQVYTSSGAGTWGPPMRIGTHPEIALLTFL
ncbi:MAG TPA: metallophosphoesterase [Terracidiphilus sp.]